MYFKLRKWVLLFIVAILCFSLFSVGLVTSVEQGNKKDLEKQFEEIPFTPFFTVRLVNKSVTGADSSAYNRVVSNPINAMLLFAREVSIYSLENSVETPKKSYPSQSKDYVPLTEDDVKLIEKSPFVKDAFLYNTISPEFQHVLKFKGREAGIFAVPPKFFADLNLPLKYGRYFNENDSPNDIVILDSLSKMIFGDKNPVGKTISGDSGRVYRVIGVIKPITSADLISMFPYMYSAAFAPLPANYAPPVSRKGSMKTFEDLGNVIAVLPEKGKFKEALRYVKSVLKNKGDKGKTLSLKFNSTYVEMERMFGFKVRKQRFKYVLYSSLLMMIISLLTAIAFIIMDMLRKQREIAIKRAVGQDLISAFKEHFIKYIMLALASFVISLVFLYALAPALRQLNTAGLKGFVSFNVPKSMLNAKPELNINLVVIVIMVVCALAFVTVAVYISLKRFFSKTVVEGLQALHNSDKTVRYMKIVVLLLVSITIIGTTATLSVQETIKSFMKYAYEEVAPETVRITPIGSQSEIRIFSGDFWFADYSFNDYLLLKRFLKGKAYVGYRKDTPFEVSLSDSVKGSNGEYVRISEATEEFPYIYNFSMSKGRFLTDSEHNTCVVGNSIAKKLHLKVGDTYMLRKVVGIIYPSNPLIDNTVFVSGQIQSKTGVIFSRKGMGSGIFLVRPKNPNDESKVTSEAVKYISTVLHPEADPPGIIDMESKVKVLENVYTSLYTLLSIFILLALLSAFLSLSALLFIEVIRRTREIGIKKAIGATAKDITKEFTMNGLTTTLIALTIGIPTGIAVSLIIEKLKGWNYYIPINILILVTLISLLLGFLFSYLPALFASKTNPVEAIKSE